MIIFSRICVLDSKMNIKSDDPLDKGLVNDVVVAVLSEFIHDFTAHLIFDSLVNVGVEYFQGNLT